MTNPTAAMLVIGDEILSGRTQDTNTHHLAGRLTEAGINLTEVRVVSDSHQQIVGAVNDLRSVYTYVFTSGGIGPTHDDITADAIAAAFEVPINIREDAKTVLATNYPNGVDDLNEARLRMARIPDGAALIDNPVSKAPGIHIGNVFVMAGVPRIFRAMLDGVLHTLEGGELVESETICVMMPEGELAGPLGSAAQDFPALTLGSYPFLIEGKFGSNVVVRGTDGVLLAAAVQRLKRELKDYLA